MIHEGFYAVLIEDGEYEGSLLTEANTHGVMLFIDEHEAQAMADQFDYACRVVKAGRDVGAILVRVLEVE